MKSLRLLVVLFLTSANVMAQSSSSFVSTADSISISGKVIGYNAADKEDFIKFQVFDITGRSHKHAVPLKNDGSFSVKLFQPFTGDIQVNYKDAYRSLIADPKSLLQLEIINSKLIRDAEFKDAIIVTGDLAKVNTQLLDFQTEFYLHKLDVSADIGDKTQADSAFANKRMLQLQEELGFLNAFIKSQPADSAFVNWQRNQFIYTAAKDVLLFPFFGKMNKSVSTENLKHFIANVQVANDRAWGNSEYYAFLNGLSNAQQIVVNINPEYTGRKIANGNNALPIYLDKADSVATGLTREIMYLNTYNPRYNSSNGDRFNAVIKDGYLKSLFEQKTLAAAKGFVKYNIPERLKSLGVNDALKKRLITFFEKQKGSNLYLDFWGDWCGPCMSEMPNYPKLIAAFNSKPIKFIFMAVGTTEKSMLNIQKKYGIKAEFINLNKNEEAIVNNLFSFQSYPSHFLIDEAGTVVSNSPGSLTTGQSVENTVSNIAKLLNF